MSKFFLYFNSVALFFMVWVLLMILCIIMIKGSYLLLIVGGV